MSNEGEQRARAVAPRPRAYEFRDRLTERERYLVTAAYHSVVTGNRDQQISAYRTVLDMYPDDNIALNNLGVIYGQLRDFQRSSDLLRAGPGRGSHLPSVLQQPLRFAGSGNAVGLGDGHCGAVSGALSRRTPK